MIGKRIKELRKSYNLTQRELASFIGTTQQQVVRYESEKSEPSIGRLKKICDLFNVPADWLLGRDHQPSVVQPSVVWEVDVSALTAAVGPQRARTALMVLGVRLEERESNGYQNGIE